MAPDDAAREAGRNLLGFVLAPTVLLHFGPNLATAYIAFARVVHHCETACKPFQIPGVNSVR